MKQAPRDPLIGFERADADHECEWVIGGNRPRDPSPRNRERMLARQFSVSSSTRLHRTLRIRKRNIVDNGADKMAHTLAI